VIYQKELKARLSGSLLQEYSQASQEHNFFDGFSTSKFSDHIWLHEAGGRGGKTLYIGDSHAQQCMPRILELLESGRGKDRGAVFLTIGLVVPIPGATGPLEQAQQEMTKGMEELGYRRDIDRIVVSANWKYFFGIGGDKYSVEGMSLGTPKGTQKAVDALVDQLDKFVRAGKKTYLILSIPTSPALDPKNIIERGYDGSFSINQQDPALKELLAEKTLATIMDSNRHIHATTSQLYPIDEHKYELERPIILPTHYDIQKLHIPEKNWSFVKYKNELCIVYSWFPLQIGKITTNELKLIESIDRYETDNNSSSNSNPGTNATTSKRDCECSSDRG
jgi:hypothetical protein